MKRILLAYDGSDPSKRALEQVAELATALKAEVSVVSVIPARPGPVPLDPWDDRAVHATALREARKALAERGIEASLLEPAGDPARTIEHGGRGQLRHDRGGIARHGHPGSVFPGQRVRARRHSRPRGGDRRQIARRLYGARSRSARPNASKVSPLNSTKTARSIDCARARPSRTVRSATAAAPVSGYP